MQAGSYQISIDIQKGGRIIVASLPSRVYVACIPAMSAFFNYGKCRLRLLFVGPGSAWYLLLFLEEAFASFPRKT